MFEKPLQKVVPANLAGVRLDIALARMFPEYSRSRYSFICYFSVTLYRVLQIELPNSGFTL